MYVNITCKHTSSSRVQFGGGLTFFLGGGRVGISTQEYHLILIFLYWLAEMYSFSEMYVQYIPVS